MFIYQILVLISAALAFGVATVVMFHAIKDYKDATNRRNMYNAVVAAVEVGRLSKNLAVQKVLVEHDEKDALIA